MQQVLVRAVQEGGVTVLVGAEVLGLVAVVDEQPFQGTGGAVEVVDAVVAGSQVVPPRRIRRAADTSPSTS